MSTINRELLTNVRNQARIRKSIIWNIDKLKLEMDSIRDINLGVIEMEKVQSNKFSDPTAEKAIKIIMNYDNKLKKLQDDLIEMDKQIENVRSELYDLALQGEISDTEYRIINHYYIDALAIGEIAVIMNYSTIWIKQIKAKALEKICLSGKGDIKIQYT